ncbi:hypothetical protein SteCoe_29012 [Stentor coeruleus]|uniref:Tubulin--tyrosine ligase-like protein 9 n=1 Tax=Stentor coeruleus TaxID=5963 RepID=A0A1R2B6X0_9CILI|nr:hypothetical protein SteCoe_29012 [Stentor coeruleus]
MKKKGSKPEKKLILNVANTKYEIIKDIAGILRWSISDKQDQDWDLLWTDTAVSTERLSKMRITQKINHFPGMYQIARKNCMALNLNKLRKLYTSDYNFYPMTWVLPVELTDFISALSHNKSKTFIVKPEASSQGRGIYLVKKPEDLQETDHYIAQQYLTKPYLIDGLKFDFRIYVLVAGCDPLKIFIHEEGLARFATETYQAPKKRNLDQAFMHLTNYAINKNNPGFIQNQEAKDEKVAHKRRLSSVLLRIEEDGHDVVALWDKICDIVIKTLCTVQPSLAHIYRSCQPFDITNSMCFEILGFDIILDHKLKPWLLEVNHSPSFTTDSTLDTEIKQKVIFEAIKIMNITPKSQKMQEAQCKSICELRATTSRSWKNGTEERQIAKNAALERRDKHEKRQKTGYIKIYPGDYENYYQKFMNAAAQNWHVYTGSKNRKKDSRPLSAKRKEPVPEDVSIPRKKSLEPKSKEDRSSKTILEVYIGRTK